MDRALEEAVGEAVTAGAVTTRGAGGLLVSHMSHVERVPALWYVQDGQIHSALEEGAAEAVGDGDGG